MPRVLAVTVAVLYLLSFLLAWTSYSLRDFSRRRLDEICRVRGREARFGRILRNHDCALLAVDLMLAAVVGLLVATGTSLALVLASEQTAAHSVQWIATIVGGVFLLCGGCVVMPWTLARLTGESWLFRVWPVVSVSLVALRPVVSVVQQLDRIVHRLSGVPEPDQGDAATLTEEILTVVDEGQREGVLESEARTMIQRVMELHDDDAAGIMTPRTEMVVIQVDTSLEDARNKMLMDGHSRVPIIGDSTDDIVGVLHAKDLLKHWPQDGDDEMGLGQIAREPFYVPETTGIDTLLEMMKRERVHLAIVLDEYSGVAGLVTMEDILEEIVGEIVDEYDEDEEDGIEQIQPGVIVVDARVHIDDLNERFSFGLPEDGDFDTIGGFVYSQLARVPKPEESCTWQRVKVTVLEADKRKVHKLRIDFDELPQPATSPETP